MRLHLLFILLLSAFTLNAQNVDNPKLKTLESQRKKALEEIEAINSNLKKTTTSKKDAVYKLNSLSKQISKRKDVINILNTEIKTLDGDIDLTNSEIVSLEKDLKIKKADYVRSIRRMQLQKSQTDRLLFIFSSENFSQAFNRIRYLKEYSDWQKEQSVEITKKQSALEEHKTNVQKQKSEKVTLVQERERESDKLKKEQVEEQVEIKKLTKKEKELLQALSKQRKQAEALNRQIEKFISDEIARSQAEAERARKENEKQPQKEKQVEVRQSETTGGYAMTKVERQLSSDFASNKGRLPFPLKGSYKITGRYGKSQHPLHKDVIVSNNGIDIKTTSNNDARAVFNGVVGGIFVVDGYKAIFVRHGNYLSMYGNLSETYVKTGTKVKTGQSLGKISSTSNGNDAVLHFEIWKERTKQNPETWLN